MKDDPFDAMPTWAEAADASPEMSLEISVEAIKDLISENVATTESPIIKDSFSAKISTAEEANRTGFVPLESPSDTAVQTEDNETLYRVEEYRFTQAAAVEMSTAEYVRQESMAIISRKMQEILETEAPITYDSLVKKTLRAFHIGRSSAQTLEATDKALQKISSRKNRQSGTIFYWRKDQNPDMYRIYRLDINSGDRRSVNEISQQEMKNAVCVILQEKGPMDKDSLVKETIRTMGYARSGSALIEAVERGIRYGRKTGEIALNPAKQFMLKKMDE